MAHVVAIRHCVHYQLHRNIWLDRTQSANQSSAESRSLPVQTRKWIRRVLVSRRRVRVVSDLIAFIRENNRRILRGMSFDDRLGRLVCQIFEGETIKPVLDLSHWLGSASISSAAISADGGTVSRSISGAQITLTVSAVDSLSDAELTITASDGRVRVEKFRFVEPNCLGRDDYGSYIGT